MYAGMKAARIYDENTRSICVECGAEQPPKASFCGECGKQSLVPPSEYRKIQDSRRDKEALDLERRMVRNRAINRIKELPSATVCSNCGIDENSSAFCTHCGANISNIALSDEAVFKLVHTELPDACPNFEEFLVLKAASPERGVIPKLFANNIMKIARTTGLPSIEP